MSLKEPTSEPRQRRRCHPRRRSPACCRSGQSSMAVQHAAEVVVGLRTCAAASSIMVAYTFCSRGLPIPRPESPFGRGVSLAWAGMMPISFWRAKVSSRILSQPWSNWPCTWRSTRAWPAAAHDRRGGVVDEERLVGRHRLLHRHPADRLVSEVEIQVVVGLAQVGLDRVVPS